LSCYSFLTNIKAVTVTEQSPGLPASFLTRQC
jgi:hypothetical protein